MYRITPEVALAALRHYTPAERERLLVALVTTDPEHALSTACDVFGLNPSSTPKDV
jgi:hypothetical protein